MTVAPTNIFDILWRIYFVGKIGKLSTHPIGNFVVATGVKRLDEEALRNVITELKAVDASTLIRESCQTRCDNDGTAEHLAYVGSAKTSVLQALVSRSGETGLLRGEISSVSVFHDGMRVCALTSTSWNVVQLLCAAFELQTYPEKKLLVPCALTMNVLKVSSRTVMKAMNRQ